jgi:hypoxanthine-guanine phosphoribosyltransferase
MINREEIIDRVSALAKMIQEDYKGRRPVMVCVLKGASPVRFDTTEFVKPRRFIVLF